MTNDFLAELKTKGQLITDYILSYPAIQKISPDYLLEGVIFYVQKGGKRLRPALLLWACEAVGGDPGLALPAAAAIELSHTWTLVHDDIIDNDDQRRGGPSMHAYFRETWRDRVLPDNLDSWSRNLAMLVGDLQQAIATSMLNSLDQSLNPELVNRLVNDLTTGWVTEVLSGEMLDMEYSLLPLDQVKEADILDMLNQKTASTLAWCVKAGALIGLNKWEPEQPTVKLLETVCRKAGLAFQLRDDILGIMGNPTELGKPVGADIREGKRTIIVLYAHQRANSDQRAILQSILGKATASTAEIDQVKKLLVDLGGIDYTRKLAEDYTSQALEVLEGLLAPLIKEKFRELVNFITQRNY